jgi:DNA-binding IclR family transcriptional regulator
LDMSGFSLNSAERCLAVLELLVECPEGMPLTAISSSLDLPASATHRLLQVLVAKGYASQEEASNRYAPTMAVAAMGLRLLARYHVPDICQPVLDDLATKSGELVRLSFFDNGRLIWIAKAQGSKSNLRYDPMTGHDVPLHVTAMGKAWLSTMTESEAVAMVARAGYAADLTGPRAIKTESELRRELTLTRARGYGLVEEEAEAGVSAIAMVIHDGLHAGARPVAALSVAGPSVRVTRDRLESLAPLLRNAVQTLSRLWAVSSYQSGRATASGTHAV